MNDTETTKKISNLRKIFTSKNYSKKVSIYNTVRSRVGRGWPTGALEYLSHHKKYFNDKEKSFLSLDSFVKLASKNKFDGVSLRPSMISTHSSKYLVNQAKKLFKVNNMKVSMITSNIHLAKNDELASDILRNITPSLDLAEKLKTSLIRIMIKNSDDIFYAKKALDESKRKKFETPSANSLGYISRNTR